jgi:hypothetical protein
MLEEIPKYLKLTPSKKKGILFLMVCLIFVVIGVWMTQSKNATDRLMGWIGVILFGAGLLIIEIQIFVPSCSYLELNDKGFTMCSLFRKHFFGWDEISDFGTGVIGHNKMVFFNFSEKYDKSKKLRNANKFICGAEGALHDTFGLKAEELAMLMTEFKNRYDSASHGNLPK